MKTEKTQTIDVTPKWENLLPMFFHWLESGEPSQKKFAKDEIKRIAIFADILMAHRKHGGLICKCGEEFDLA